jgi:hypothetical protein
MRSSGLEGLPPCVLPLQPTKTKYRIPVRVKGKIVTRTVTCYQYLITAAYAFTDYCSQGQMIPAVYIDIATPPTGMLDLFHLYIALSQSSGQMTICLLRDFEEKIFMQSHNSALMDEDRRLEELNRKTQESCGEQ